MGTDLGAIGRGLAAVKISDPKSINAFLANEISAYPGRHLLAWATADGRITAASDPEAVGTDVQDRRFFEQATSLPEGQWVVSDLMQGRASGHLVFVVARPVHSPSGQYRRCHRGPAGAGRSGTKHHAHRRNDDETLLLFDSEGRLVYREPDVSLPWDPRNPNFWGRDTIDTALGGHEVVGAYRSPLNGQMRMEARVPVAGLHWVVGVGRPMTQVSGPLWSTIKAVGGLNLLVLAVSVTLMLLISRLVARDVEALRRHVLALGQDKEPPRMAESRISEVRELNAAFDQMVHRRRQAERVLEEAHCRAAWLARLPDENPSPMMRVSSAGEVLYQNPSAAKVPGWSSRLGSAVPGPLFDLVQEAFARQQEVRQDVQLGEQFYAISIMPVMEEGYANLYGRDITERKAFEEHLRQAVTDLGRFNRDLEQFAYVASHDLQEPLRMVTGYLELLEQALQGKLDEETRTFIRFAVDGADGCSGWSAICWRIRGWRRAVSLPARPRWKRRTRRRLRTWSSRSGTAARRSRTTNCPWSGPTRRR